ncbi:hypothetical protein LTS08_003356 [Lithohypha guttulata]|nr:hypothetical protein LTS08_003356 [Lithohypha guttulata]
MANFENVATPSTDFSESLSRLTETLGGVSPQEPSNSHTAGPSPPPPQSSNPNTSLQRWLSKPEPKIVQETAIEYHRNAADGAQSAGYLNQGIHQTALDHFGQQIIVPCPMVVQDAFRGELPLSIYLHIKSRVVYDRQPLLNVLDELRIRRGVEIRWLASVQLGFDLIAEAANHHGLDLSWADAGMPTRSAAEVEERKLVHTVRYHVWEAFCWRGANWDQVKIQREEYLATYGDGWTGDDKLEEKFIPWAECPEFQYISHTQPFYVDIDTIEVDLVSRLSQF